MNIAELEKSQKKFAESFRIERARLKKSKTQIAKELDVNTKTITSWENGTFPKLEIMLDICKKFDCDIGYLTDPKQKERKKAVQDASETTGLSAAAIEKLQSDEFGSDLKAWIDYLIRSDESSEIAELLYSIRLERVDLLHYRHSSEYKTFKKVLTDKKSPGHKELKGLVNAGERIMDKFESEMDYYDYLDTFDEAFSHTLNDGYSKDRKAVRYALYAELIKNEEKIRFTEWKISELNNVIFARFIKEQVPHFKGGEGNE